MADRVENQASPFDERAALEELDHLREQIERYKAERQAVEEEFDQFIQSFKSAPEASAAQHIARPLPSPAPTEPVEWTRPVFPVEPVERTTPHLEEIEPMGPSEPSATFEPAEPVVPEASYTLAEMFEAFEPAPQPERPQPVARLAPVEPIGAASPVVPVAPAEESTLTDHFSAVPPALAQEPAEPLDAAASVRPSEPLEAAEIEPVETIEPAAAEEPRHGESFAMHFPAEFERPPAESDQAAEAPMPMAAENAAESRAPRSGLLLPGVIVLLVAGGFLTWTLLKPDPEPAAQTSPAPAPAPAAAAPETPAAVPPPAAASPFESELTTIRAVWVRVLADGERVVERELPAGARVPFKAQKTIAIRTGDAGAVRLSIGGQDQGFLGREGAVVTRTFTVPSAPSR